MQGVFINGQRPKFKKDVATYIDEGQDPQGLVIEATSIFGNEFGGSLTDARKQSQNGPFYIVGPDPHTSRKWYLTIKYNTSKNEWEVK